jgi:hypothetical protein
MPASYEHTPSLSGAQDIGNFTQADRFINADLNFLDEMRLSVCRVQQECGYWGVPLGNLIDGFNSTKLAGGLVIASFLGKVREDVLRLQVLPQSAINNHAASVYGPVVWKINDHLGELHTDDPFLEPSALNLRFITSNSQPTIIPEVPALQAGRIARIKLGETLHRRPPIIANKERPRALLFVDL